MRILLIDTCGETGTIALADVGVDGTSITAASLPGRTASERLLPSIKELVGDMDSLGCVIVVHGPGSFTGVRVGVSAAKGLCEALDLPIIAISRLAVLAELVDVPAGTRIQAVVDAGRGEFYCGSYIDGGCVGESLATREELLAQSSKHQQVTVVCEPAVAASLAGLGALLVAHSVAESALLLALRRIRNRDFDDAATLDANYLRRTDAEIFAKPKTHAAVVETPAR